MNEVNKLQLKGWIYASVMSLFLFGIIEIGSASFSCPTNPNDYNNNTFVINHSMTPDQVMKSCINSVNQAKSIVWASPGPLVIWIVIQIFLKLSLKKWDNWLKNQNGKCYRCNSSIADSNEAYFDQGHAYCNRCGEILFPDKPNQKGNEKR